MTESDGLAARHRVARAVAGGLFLAPAPMLWARPLLRPLAIGATWFGVSHLVAAATAYDGCPEIGAIASVVRGEDVVTGCGPWGVLDRWIDRLVSE
ncbi:MAG: hypothetical protein M3285_12925 [Actinomycetota bacterium]|nr:hypothetical protein [Actinomycetota bacterium]